MSAGLVDKVYIGLDNAPAAFDIKGRILGPNGTNLEYIRSETGVVAVLKADKLEPLHLNLHHTRSEALAAARSLAQNLIETIRAELAQWSAAQAGGPPPALNVPPPTLATSAPPPVQPPAVTAATTPPAMTSTAPPTMPVVSVASATAPLMTVRQPTVLQLLSQPQQQQQYVLNQENGQLIPIVQQGMQCSNTNFTSLPIAQQLGLQQHNFGTQLVDLSSMQPVNVTQLRLNPSSMSMILPNGLNIPQASLTSNDTTTVSSATSTPVVCAAPSTNSSQKILYSTDKGDKEVKYHIQGADGMQWTMPGSQTMLIPYQQLQELAGQQGLSNLHHQQYVSIAPAGGLQQTALPFSAAQLQQLQAGGTIMQLNQKNSTPTKTVQESRGQKRLSDGSPSQLQLRPIAPAGSVSQEKGTREARTWTSAGTARENTVVSMGMKINPAHGTIIHVSSGQQTNVSASGMPQDNTGVYIRHIDRSIIQKDQKQDITKVQNQNMQMISVPPGMTVLQNPLNISQMPTMLGQPNSQVYMIPTNQNLVQGGIPQGLIGQQMLPGQNVTVMQPNQLGMPGGVQYNVPLMQMPHNSQYMSGLNLNSQLSAQQLNAALAGQLQIPGNQLGSIPIVQQSALQNPQQLLPQNTFMTPTSQYGAMPQQYIMPTNSGTITVPANPNVQYTLPASQAPPNNGSGIESACEGENSNGNGNNYIAQENYPASGTQTFSTDTATQANLMQPNPSVTPTYGTNGSTQTPTFSQTAQSNYGTNGSSQTGTNYPTPPASSQSAPQQSFSPSPSPAPQNYPAPNMPVAYPPNQNPYPNATGQNLAAYASNQYQYNSRPWFRPRYSSPQGSPYSAGTAPPGGPPMGIPPPTGNFNYWQDS